MFWNNLELWKIFVGLCLLWLMPFSVLVVTLITQNIKNGNLTDLIYKNKK